MIEAPSGVQRSSPSSAPSSSTYVVSCLPLYAGGSATHILRTPLAFRIHAILPPLGEAARSDGNGALRTSSSVNCLSWASVRKTVSAQNAIRAQKRTPGTRVFFNDGLLCLLSFRDRPVVLHCRLPIADCRLVVMES